MKSPADIITRLQLISQDGTKSDRRLAGLVLSDLDFASKAAIVFPPAKRWRGAVNGFERSSLSLSLDS